MGSVHDTVDEIVRRSDFGDDDEPPEFEVVVEHTRTYYIRTSTAKRAVQAALEAETQSDDEYLEIRVTALANEEDVDEPEESPEEGSK
jgi:hypothetical protein